MLGKKRINIFHGDYTSADSVQPIHGIALFLFSKISQNVFTDWRFCFKILSVPNYIRTWTDRQETWYMYAVSFSICVGGYRVIS